MSYNRIIRTIGYISEELIQKYNLYFCKNREIVQSLDFYLHVYKHMKEFKNQDDYNYAVTNIEKILSNPDYVHYDKKHNSLLYFKKINQLVCVVVRLNIFKNKSHYVATIYPVNKNKIEKLRKMLNNK